MLSCKGTTSVLVEECWSVHGFPSVWYAFFQSCFQKILLLTSAIQDIPRFLTINLQYTTRIGEFPSASTIIAEGVKI